MLYVASVAFALGIAVATLETVVLAEIAFVAGLGFVFAVVAKRHKMGVGVAQLWFLSVFLFLFSLGLLRAEWHELQYETSPLYSYNGQEYVFSGTVSREPDRRERTTHLYVEGGEETVLLYVDRFSTYQYGDKILVSGVLETPASFETDLGRTFNYPEYLLARDVSYTMRYPTVTLITNNQGNPVIALLLTLKGKLLSEIASVIPEPQGGLAAGLLLGVKQALGDSLETAFRQSGVIHIVVLSGYNVMLVVAFFRFFLRPLPRLWQTVLGIMAIVAFALLVGLSATVVRASIMAGLVVLAWFYARSYDVLRALCVAGLAMIFVNPYLLLYDIGFQLSFMATLGLVLIAPRLETAIVEGQWFGVKEFFLATVATQIAVLPLLLYHIGEVSVVAVLVNMLVLPVVPFAMFGAFFAGLVALFLPTVALPIAFLTTALLTFIISTAEWFSRWQFSTLTIPTFTAYWVLVGYLVPLLIWFVTGRGYFKKDEFSDWEIVDVSAQSEDEHEARGKKAVPAKGSNQRDTPVFFK